MDYKVVLDHERLRVYQKGIEFIAFVEDRIAGVPTPSRNWSIDNLDRAAVSIVHNVALGNAKSTAASRLKYFETGCASALECAACLDIMEIKELISESSRNNGKECLADVCRMLVGLCRSEDRRENAAELPRAVTCPQGSHVRFNHEQLDVYRRSLKLVRCLHDLAIEDLMPAAYQGRLDKLSTSICLNIAEGNGRFSRIDHKRFLTIATESALQAAAWLDVAAAKGLLEGKSRHPAKQLMVRIVQMLEKMKQSLSSDNAGC